MHRFHGKIPLRLPRLPAGECARPHWERGLLRRRAHRVSCQDRRFLYRHMPKLEAYFHYRHIDVSTIKELAKRWYPKVMKELVKESKHIALDDIKESIDELRFYREKILLPINSI